LRDQRIDWRILLSRSLRNKALGRGPGRCSQVVPKGSQSKVDCMLLYLCCIVACFKHFSSYFYFHIRVKHDSAFYLYFSHSVLYLIIILARGVRRTSKVESGGGSLRQKLEEHWSRSGVFNFLFLPRNPDEVKRIV
jgi:hypothetical protein